MQLQRTLVTLNPVTGETQAVPERRGTTVRGSLPALDLDRWQPLIAEAGTASGAPGAGDGAGYDVKIGVLDAMASACAAWRCRGRGRERLVGEREHRGIRRRCRLPRRSRRPAGGALLALRATRGIAEREAGESIKELPALDIVADNFVHRGRKLGRVEVQARHEGRDWRLDKLAMTNSDSAFSGNGLWKQGEVSRTSLAFKLDVSDVGQFLDRFGSPDHIKGGPRQTGRHAHWNGDPLTMDYATLGGALQMQVEDGQFLEIEPGIGKLVSLSEPADAAAARHDGFPRRVLQGIPVRPHHQQHGDRARRDGGEEFHMNGPAADVVMSGQVDLSLETQNLSVKVIPQLGDSASTVVGCASHRRSGHADRRALMKNPLGKAFRVRLYDQRHLVGSQGREAAARHAVPGARRRNSVFPTAEAGREENRIDGRRHPDCHRRCCLLAPFDLESRKLAAVFGALAGRRLDYADLYFQYTRAESWSLEEASSSPAVFRSNRASACARFGREDRLRLLRRDQLRRLAGCGARDASDRQRRRFESRQGGRAQPGAAALPATGPLASLMDADAKMQAARKARAALPRR
ncbi:MAG: AsmA-like C-terminal region-containing protein [Verrucomicrobiota bacterium]